MRHLEIVLSGLFLAAWISSLLHGLGWISFAGTLETTLQGYYLLCGALGWVAGNLYVQRRRALDEQQRKAFSRHLLIVYTIGPAGLVLLVWSMEPAVAQQALPLVPIWAWGVMGIFFLVPVLLRRWPRVPPKN
ncbi:MAG: hypothetical protein AAGD01_16535 [Acidobacteriota bacterium]